MNINYPLNKESSWSIFNLCWQLDFLKVVRLKFEGFFLLSHVVINISSELSYELRVSHIKLVCKSHVFCNIFFVNSKSFPKVFWDCLNFFLFGFMYLSDVNEMDSIIDFNFNLVIWSSCSQIRALHQEIFFFCITVDKFRRGSRMRWVLFHWSNRLLLKIK